MKVRAGLTCIEKSQLFYRIRKCDSLEGPAIFWDWTGCKFFVGTKKDDSIEFQILERIVNAASYDN